MFILSCQLCCVIDSVSDARSVRMHLSWTRLVPSMSGQIQVLVFSTSHEHSELTHLLCVKGATFK